jgi:hypothetical protein
VTTPQEEYRIIPLTRGQTALVSAIDFGWINQWNWYAKWEKSAKRFYAARAFRVGSKNQQVLMHRQILGIQIGEKIKGDHRDPSATLDNRRSNLRLATGTQNNANSRLRVDNTTGFKGVTKTKKGRFMAQIRTNGKRRHLGYRGTAEEAGKLYQEAAKECFGEYARF